MSTFAELASPEQPGLPQAAAAGTRSGSALGLLDAAVGSLAALALSALIAIVFLSVLARYAFNSSFVWSEEVAQWLYIAVIFLGMPLAAAKRWHMTFDILARRLPPPAQRTVLLLVDGIVAYTLFAILFGGIRVIETIGGTSPTLGIPEWLRFALVPVAASLAILAGYLRALVDGRAPWTAAAVIAVAALVYCGLNESGSWSWHIASPSLVAVAAFFVVLVIGVPVPYAMLFGLFAVAPFGSLLPAPAALQNLVSGASRFLLLAIPFFLTAAVLMNAGGLSARLINVARLLVGHRRAGMAQTTLVTNTLFSGLSGSSNADAALGAKLLVPALRAAGYEAPYACAVVAATAVLPNIIPPSIAFLILAAATNQSVADLWTAGLGVGLFLAAVLAVAIHILGDPKDQRTVMRKATWTERLHGIRQALPVLALALIIFGGIRLGITTPTEAGVVAAVYALVLGWLVYRTFTARSVWHELTNAAAQASMVGMLIGAGTPFAFLLTVDQVPGAVTHVAELAGNSRLFVLVGANLIMLVAGCFLDIGAAILILAPLLMPAALAAGIDPVHFGVIVVVNLMIHGLTPPVGILVYITSALTGTRAAAVFRAVLPLFGALLVGLAIISAFPVLSLFLLR